MNDSIGTGRIIPCLNKETFLKFTFKSLLGGDFLWTQHRETLLVEIQRYSVKVFSAIHVRIATWIDYLTSGWNPFVFSTRIEFLCTIYFLFNHFIILLQKNIKSSFQVFFYSVKIVPIPLKMRVIRW
jgi:hypothetical protein